MSIEIIINVEKNCFEVHHDEEKDTGLKLVDLLMQYQKQKLKASIWLDFKNLNDSNAAASLTRLIEIRNKFGLQNKILIESDQAGLLVAFADSNFFTSYYTPFFNPYLINDNEATHWVDSISKMLKKSNVNALSGYYFQYPFLRHYFPGYPILIWSGNDSFSLVNWLYQKKIEADTGVFISLYP